MQRKITMVFICILTLSSFVTLLPVSGTTKLATPQFTVAYTDNSYATASYPTTDPYTGKLNEVPSIQVDNRTIKFTIKGTTATNVGEFYYAIRMKGHFSENWTSIYKGWVNSSGPEVNCWIFSTFRGYNLAGQTGYFYRGGESFYVPKEGEMDFQVKAQTWGEVMADRTATNPFGGSVTTLFGESDWSSTQTVTITSIAPNTSPTPSPSTATPTTNVTPTQPSSQTSVFGNLSWEVTALLAGLVFAVAVLMVGMVVLWRKVNTRGTK
jgi:hypothetical protein